MAEHPVAKTLRGLADALSGAPPRLKIAFTALGSEFSTDVLLSAAEQVADRLLPVIIGPKPIPGFPGIRRMNWRRRIESWSNC